MKVEGIYGKPYLLVWSFTNILAQVQEEVLSEFLASVCLAIASALILLNGLSLLFHGRCDQVGNAQLWTDKRGNGWKLHLPLHKLKWAGGDNEGRCKSYELQLHSLKTKRMKQREENEMRVCCEDGIEVWMIRGG